MSGLSLNRYVNRVDSVIEKYSFPKCLSSLFHRVINEHKGTLVNEVTENQTMHLTIEKQQITLLMRYLSYALKERFYKLTVM